MNPTIVCSDCGREKPHHARGLCRGCYKRQWRQDPENRDRDRQFSLDWKHRNLERVRAYNRKHAMDGCCSTCDGPIRRGSDGGVCQSCRAREMRARREQICAMWADGLLLKDIAAALGWTRNHLSNEVDRMRNEGWDLPYRYKTYRGKREAVAA